MRCFIFLFLLYVIVAKAQIKKTSFYNNPIIMKSLPDPTVIRTKDKSFYLYATEDMKNLPIWRSFDLVNWEFIGSVFTDYTHPNFYEGGMIWAPDINYIDGKYVLYYALSKWGEKELNGIGIAVSQSPEGPFEDKGKLFLSKEIGVQNSIDPFYYEENGKKYLFWGAFRGIFGIELTNDGLEIKKGASKIQIAGSFMEATAIEKHGGYFYLFGSTGTCCEGANSKYHITYGRSKSLFGPYMTKDGKLLSENYYETLIVGNDNFVGPGHQSRLIKDDNGQDWLIYHGYIKDNPKIGRVIFMDKLDWKNGWPFIEKAEPSSVSVRPYFE